MADQPINRVRWKPRLARAGALLLLGAAVNVAVAWGCALWEPTLGSLGGNGLDRLAINRLVLPPPQEPLHPDQPGLEIGDHKGAGLRITDKLIIDIGSLRSVRAGWPSLAMSGEQYNRQFNRCALTPCDGLRPSDDPARLLPLRPLWPGFAINTIFYAAILRLILGAPRLPRLVVGRMRIKRGLCPACAYPVGSSPVCTECGKPVTPKTVESPT